MTKAINTNESKGCLSRRDAFLIFLFVRLASVVLVQTWFVPDDYWQSMEVAHNLAFGYGYLTWEWALGIRSYLQPLAIAIAYKLLQFVGLDRPEVLIYTPRVVQAILSAYADLRFFEWCGMRRWSVFIVCTSWFLFYTGSRTMINTLETSLTTIALANYPWVESQKGSRTFITLIALLSAMRPTAVIQWCPLCFCHIFRARRKAVRKIFHYYLPIGTVVLLISILIDSCMHGSFVITGYEFLKLNVLKNIGAMYGVHPWYWYFVSGFPAIMGTHFIIFLFATVYIVKNAAQYQREIVLLITILFTLSAYSFIPHKEFRFVMPLLPMAFYICTVYMVRWSQETSRCKLLFVAGAILITNVIPAWYVGFVHQRGTLDVMEKIRPIANTSPHNRSLLFLMPCHSTPLYSHLHVNVSVRFLTCEPNLNASQYYMGEMDAFYRNPTRWVKSNVKKLPTHIVTFDTVVPLIADLLSRYKPVHRLFHTSFPDERVGRHVIVHEKL